MLFEIKPCISSLDSEDCAEFVESDADAEFFAVYQVKPDGSKMLLRDYPSRALAQRYVTRLQGAH